ncbi:hypothetical protein CB0940_05314 [Cercospora beticola]|uniref:F-box domain-containing protein n=1 Tax=Cercospora beticola TaxID=122368 RepID=A0A2G5HXV5_CERBT|nr:hypothetical protein CB0940_05314 [Cercospora beticola]PIA97331.1 hypothetical protein CB0940_05314 [Cercospora beticola]WPA97849.1 hypothetical protein RHO25_002460 [Cercospora beticola]CAK1359046.1 unnamed protein product [Cercospora beticola]
MATPVADPPTLDSLPQEIFEMAADNLCCEDLGHLRATNYNMLAKTKRTFIAHTFQTIGFNLNDEEGLQEAITIAKTREFGTAIRKLCLYTDELNLASHYSTRAFNGGKSLQDKQQEFRVSKRPYLLLTALFSTLRRDCNIDSVFLVDTSNADYGPKPVLGSTYRKHQKMTKQFFRDSSHPEDNTYILLEALSLSGIQLQGLYLVDSQYCMAKLIGAGDYHLRNFEMVLQSVRHLGLSIRLEPPFTFESNGSDRVNPSVSMAVGVISRAPYLQTIHLIDGPTKDVERTLPTDLFARTLLSARLMPSLRRLILDDGRMEAQDLVQMVAKQPSLEKLHLANFEMWNTRGTLSAEKTVRESLQQITGLGSVIVCEDTEAKFAWENAKKEDEENQDEEMGDAEDEE